MIDRFDCTWRIICHKAAELKLRRPKPNTCQVRRDYFHILDSDEKAYWLGFIAAAGTVVHNGRKYAIVLDLQPGDLHWLERFRNTIAPGSSITKHSDRSYSVCIASMEMFYDVTAYGIGPRKSNTLEWPRIPESAVIPFLLGYFDGDGSLIKRPDRPGWQWRLIGTLPFITTARQYIQQYAQVPIHEPVRDKKDKSPHLYRIVATGQRAIAITGY